MKIKKTDIAEKNLFGEIKDSAKTAQAEVELLKTTIKLLVEQAKQFKQSIPNNAPKNLPELKKQNLLIRDSALLTKEWVKSENALTKAKAKADVTSKTYRESVAKLRLEQSRLNKEAKQQVELSNKETSAYRKKGIELANLKRKIKDLIVTQGAESKQVKKLLGDYDKLNSKVRLADKTVGDFGRNVGNYPSKMSGAISSLKNLAGSLGLVAGVAGVVRVLKNTIKIYKDFEQGNANLSAVLGKSKKEIVALTKDAKRLGSVTSFTATQVSELQVEFAKLGFNEQEILAATEATLNLAAATGSELGEAAAIAGATLGGFGLDASETGRVTDVMAKSFSTSALDLEKFKESMKGAAPAAKAVGISVEQTTALLGTLANAGISGSKAGNNLKTSFINLNAAGLTLEQGLEKVANSEDKLGTAAKLVGKNAAASFLVLADGVDVTKELERGLKNAGGAAKEMADKQLDTLSGKTKILGSAWEGLVLSLLSGDSAFSSISKSIIETATNVLSLLTPAESLTDTWLTQRDVINELESGISPLLDRYDELKGKTTLTKDEQIELDDIILKVAKDIPTAITQFDKYGKAMDISTKAGRAVIQQHKDLLALTNADAIKENLDDISGFNKDLRILSTEFKMINGELTKVTFSPSSGITHRKANEEQTKYYKNRKFEIQSEIDLRNASIAILKGEKTELEKLAESKKTLNNGQETPEEKAKREKAEQKEKDRLKKLADDKKKIKSFTTEDLENELDELEEIQTNHSNKLYDITFKAEQKRLKALEDLQKVHNEDARKLAEIDYKKQLELIKEQEEKEKEALKNKLIEAEKAEELRLKKLAESYERKEAIIQGFTDKFTEAADKRISKIDEEINAAQKQADFYKQLASEGNITAEQSLAEQNQIIAESEAEKAKIEQRKRNIELVSSVVLAYNNSLSEGNSSADALKDAFLGAATIKTFMSSLPTFFDGTENTGQHGYGVDGRGGFDAILHPNERVMTSVQNDMIGNVSNEDVAKIMFDHRMGNMEMGQNIVITKNDNANLESEMRNVTDAIKNIPQNNIELAEINQGYMVINQTKRQGNRTTTNRFKVN